MTGTDRSFSLPGMILAGGLSRRMGRNKCVEMLGQYTLVEHTIRRLLPQVDELWINCGPGPVPGWAADTGLLPISDSIDGHEGPLAGVLSGLDHCRQNRPDVSHLVTVPADTPFFPPDLVARMSAAVHGTDATAIAAHGGHRHQVFALWSVSVLDDLANWLNCQPDRSIGAFLARHEARIVEFPAQDTSPAGDPFFNINRPEDLETARAFLPPGQR